MIRTKQKIYSEINDPNTVLSSDTNITDKFVQSDSNKAIKIYDPGPNKILIIASVDDITYSLATLSWFNRSNALLGTDGNGNVVFIDMETAPVSPLNELIDDTGGGGSTTGDGDPDPEYEYELEEM